MSQSENEANFLSSCKFCAGVFVLLRCLCSYLSSRYQQAEQISFTVLPRGSKEDQASRGRLDSSEALSPAAGRTSSASSPGQVDKEKEGALQSGCLGLF